LRKRRGRRRRIRMARRRGRVDTLMNTVERR